MDFKLHGTENTNGTDWSCHIQYENGGVRGPQGSMLGPIFYLIYTNKFPEIMKEENCQENCRGHKDDLFGTNCIRCRQMVCFADDSTLVTARRSSQDNIVIMKTKLTEVTLFLESNEFSINQEKTTTQNFMVKQKRARVPPDPPVLIIQIREGEKEIWNKEHVKLLGLNLQRDLSWISHIETEKKPLIKELRKRLGGLKHWEDNTQGWKTTICKWNNSVKTFIYDGSVGGGPTKNTLTNSRE